MPEVPITVWLIAGSLALQGISYVLAQAMQPKAQDPAAPQTGTSLQENTTTSTAQRPRIYGRTRIGGNRTYIGTSGDNNNYLHIIMDVCEGPIQGLVNIDGVDQVWIAKKLWNDPVYAGKVYYEFFTGAADQVPCATLHAAIPDWNEAKRYGAYIYVRLLYDSNTWQSIPDIEVTVDGLLVYDPGSGLTAFSNNAALTTRDYLTAPSTRGGMGIAASRIDDTSAIASAAYCTTKGWTCNFPITDNQAVTDNLNEMLMCWRGAVIFSQNKFKLKYLDLNYEASVMDLTELDIAEASAGGDSSLDIEQPSVFGTPNAVRIQFLNVEKQYQQDEYPFSDAASVASDGGDFREQVIKIHSIDDTAKAAKMAAYLLARLRINKPISFTGHARTQALEPLDLITLTHRAPGWVLKLLRVQSAAVTPDGTVAITTIEEYAELYADAYNLQDHNWHDTTLPDPTAAVASVTGIAHTEEVYNYRDRSFTRWKIAWTPPDPTVYPWWKHAEIWLKIGSGDWKSMTTAQTGYEVDPVEEGQSYTCKIVSVSIFDTKQPFADAPSVQDTIVGKTSLPSDLAPVTALTSGDTVTIMGTALTDPDIKGYECRLGSSFQGGLFFDYRLSPAFRMSGVKPGQFTFWVAPVDNGGRHAANPRSATVTVNYPAGYTDKNTWAWDFSTGTLTNVEETTYGGNNCLKCSHAGGVLAGSWVSPAYDLGSIKTIRCWGDFVTDFYASGLTWGGLIPSPNTWAQLDVSRAWADIFSAVAAGKISALIEWGTSPGTYFGSADFFQITAPEFQARYVRVTATIIDPTLDANTYLRTLNMKAAYWQ